MWPTGHPGYSGRSAFLDRTWDRRREEAAIGDVDSERSLKDEALQPPRAAT